jgi:hypothetical protein
LISLEADHEEAALKARDVMSRDVVTVSPEETVLHAVRIMLQRKFSGLPVVDAAGALVGIVSEGDLLRRAETGTVRRRPRWVELLAGPGGLAGEYAHAADGRALRLDPEPRALLLPSSDTVIGTAHAPREGERK